LNIVGDSINALQKADAVNMEVLYSLDDEAVWIDHERMVKVLVELEINAGEDRLTVSHKMITK
jgi:hypothetical protein